MEEQWSHPVDFTQIKPRRPEGDWEEGGGAFSFLWPGVGGVKENGGGEGGRCDEEKVREGEELQQEEFEFRSTIMSTSTSKVVERLGPSGTSPADELFFKGQLLPLHLPPRIQMVKKLVLERQHAQREQQQLHQEEALPQVEAAGDVRNGYRRADANMGQVNAAMNALSQARFARLFQPKYSKLCNVGSTEVVLPAAARLGNSWWDPREGAHAHEYSSGGSFTSTDRDSSGDSSSSRDSNGSSQDCFDSSTSKEHFHAADIGKGFFHNREVFSTHSAHPERSSGISTWLRPPFKWKVLFGAKKPSSATSKPFCSSYDIDLQPRAHSMETAGPPELFSASPVSTDRYYSDCSGELTHSGDLLVSPRAFVHGGDMEKFPRGMERARGYLQRYMKALNPIRSKDHHHSSTTGPGEGPASTRASPAITTSKMFPPFSQSFRFSPRDIPLRMKARPPPPSPMPVPRRVSTSSASSDLHCDIKGAIAHCKESQKQRKQDGEGLLEPKCGDGRNVVKVNASC